MHVDMTIEELIHAVGSENIRVQYVHECLVRAQTVKRGVDLTIGTVAVTQGDLLSAEWQNVGILLWVPRDKFKQAVAEAETSNQRKD